MYVAVPPLSPDPPVSLLPPLPLPTVLGIMPLASLLLLLLPHPSRASFSRPLRLPESNVSFPSAATDAAVGEDSLSDKSILSKKRCS